MPNLVRNDTGAPLIIERAPTVQNESKPFALSSVKTPNFEQKIAVNEAIRHAHVPAAQDDPLNHYGGQKLP